MQPFFKIFNNNMRLVFKKVESDRPASVFVCVKTGSVNENAENNGISHLIEHLTFKGTEKRTAKQISVELEEIGANANAYTSKNHTCYFATSLNDKLKNCFDLLSDIIFHSKYSEDEIEKEKKVVIEEMDMYADDPESVCNEEFCKNFYAGSTLSMPIIGSRETLSKIKRQDIIDYVRTFYTPENIVVSVVADMDFDEVASLTQRYFVSVFPEKNGEISEPNKSSVIIPDKKITFVKKDIQQTQVNFGFPCDNNFSENKYAYILMTFIFGGGMGSRLFQKIREQHGLVYSISCVPELYDTGGDIAISFGTNAKNQESALNLIKEEIDLLVKGGFTKSELNRAKNFCKTLLVSSTELGVDIAKSLALSVAFFNKIITIDDKLKEVENVTLEQINDLAKKTFNYSNICGAVVSNEPNEECFKVFD